jgi:hypothetical protein
LASNVGAFSVCVFAAGALVTMGELLELVPSDCSAWLSDSWACA